VRRINFGDDGIPGGFATCIGLDVESSYSLKPAWCGTHCAGLWAGTGLTARYQSHSLEAGDAGPDIDFDKGFELRFKRAAIFSSCCSYLPYTLA